MSTTIQAEIPNLAQQELLRVTVLSSISSGDPLEENLEHLGFRPYRTDDPHEVLAQVAAERSCVVLCDAELPSMEGLAFLREALRLNPAAQVILVADSYTPDAAVQAIKQGAYDYVARSAQRSQVKIAIEALAERVRRRGRIRQAERQLSSDLNFYGMIGQAPEMSELFDEAERIARHFSSLLVSGPSGSGKELLAHAIHRMSPASTQRFVVCSCSAPADGSLEQQLFGAVRGVPSKPVGAEKPGLLEYASGGTIFLDEIGEVPLAVQAKILRVIVDQDYRAPASPAGRRAGVKVIAASARDLRTEVLAGRFREDLFCRLSAVQIRVPSLAERCEDVPLLVDFFLSRYNTAYHKQIEGTTNRAMSALLHYTWPGNVRELENVVSAAALADVRGLVDLVDLPEHLQKPAETPDQTRWQPLPLREIRREHIERVLDACHGNRVRAAQLLGIGRTSLYRYLKRRNRGRGAPSADAA